MTARELADLYSSMEARDADAMLEGSLRGFEQLKKKVSTSIPVEKKSGQKNSSEQNAE